MTVALSWRVPVGVLASVVLAGSTATLSAPAAQAATCAVAPVGAPGAPFYRRDVDADPGPAVAARVQRALDATAARGSARGSVAGSGRTAPATIVVPIRAHVVKGTHRGDRHTTRAQVIAQVKRLNQAYDGQEAPGVAPDTHVRFRLRSITATVDDKWFHITGPGPTADRMKRSLHQGRSFTLNLYFVDLSRKGLLGYTTFPWRYRAHPRLDGVVVAYDTVPGGRLAPYDQGDTAVHEVGHWLGLLHTFQGGCDGAGDGVADTPAEADPQYGCDTTADTCPSPGTDPVHNFMDYSRDSCMYEFTPGQAERMRTAWSRWRQR